MAVFPSDSDHRFPPRFFPNPEGKKTNKLDSGEVGRRSYVITQKKKEKTSPSTRNEFPNHEHFKSLAIHGYQLKLKELFGCLSCTISDRDMDNIRKSNRSISFQKNIYICWAHTVT